MKIAVILGSGFHDTWEIPDPVEAANLVHARIMIGVASRVLELDGTPAELKLYDAQCERIYEQAVAILACRDCHSPDVKCISTSAFLHCRRCGAIHEIRPPQ